MEGKEYLGFTHQQWQTLILFGLLVAVMMLAYNIGHYTSIEYQKMIEGCNFPSDEINFTVASLQKRI